MIKIVSAFFHRNVPWTYQYVCTYGDVHILRIGGVGYSYAKVLVVEEMADHSSNGILEINIIYHK